MKKTILQAKRPWRFVATLLTLLTLSVGSTKAASITSDGTMRLFFNMNAVNWWVAGTEGDGNFAYFYSGSGSAWSAHSVQQTGNYYYVVVPAGTWENVILTRNNTNSNPDWGNKWNQTGDIVLQADKNYISAFSENSATVTWSTYQLTSTASLAASSASVTTAQTATLTPSLSSNADYNEVKSTTYAVTTNPGSAGSVTSAGVFSATAAGTYTVTATVTYNAKGFAGITKTATATQSITVSATQETTHAVALSYVCTATSATVSAASNQTIGEESAVSVSAPTVAGYTFVNWTLGTGISNESANTSANPISVKTLASGTYTMQANYAEDLSTPYVLNGGAAFGSTAWSQALPFTKKSGHSTESVGYLRVTMAKTNNVDGVDDNDFCFKIVSNGAWYGLPADGETYWMVRTTTEQTMSDAKNIQLRADAPGDYEIKVDYSTPASPKITVTFPAEVKHTVGVAAGEGGQVNITSVEAGPSTASASIAATANTGYYFAGWVLPESGVTIASGSATTSPITVNASADEKSITARFAPIWALQGSWALGDVAAWHDSTYLFTDYAKSAGKDTAYIELNLAANTRYEFLMVERTAEGKEWYKNANETYYINYAENNNQYWGFSSTNTADCGLQTAAAGTYRFVWNSTDKQLKVIFPTSYTVSFGHGAGGSSVTATVDDEPIASGSYVPAGTNVVFGQEPVAGYVFKGWYTTADGNTPVALSENTLRNLGANAAVYAQYTPGEYTVTLHTNSGVIAEGKNVTGYTFGVGAALPTAEQITRAGHTFLGWYANEGTSGESVTAIAATEYGNKEYWAKWDKDPVLALTGSKSSGVEVGETITLTATAENCTPSSYAFYEGETLLKEYTTSNMSQTHSYMPATAGDKTLKVVVTHASGSIQTTLNVGLSTPEVALAVKAGSKSEVLFGKESTILVATPSHVGAGVTPTYVFTDQAETPVVSASQTATEWSYTPGDAGAKTMKVTMTVGGEEYTATAAVTVYEQWNIYVHDVSGWNTVYLYTYEQELNGTWPGAACWPIEEGSTWYSVALDSRAGHFILNNNNNGQQTIDLNMDKATYAPGSYWYMTKGDQDAKFSLHAAELADPTVALAYDSVVNTNQLYLRGEVANAGNDGENAADMKEVGFYVGETKYKATMFDGKYFYRYVSDLAAGTQYAVKAYAVNIHGEGKSEAKNITTRAEGSRTIRVRIAKGAGTPKLYAFTDTRKTGETMIEGGLLQENGVWNGVAMTKEIEGAANEWYKYEIGNAYNYFVISVAGEADKTPDIVTPETDMCYWYNGAAAEAEDRYGVMSCPYTTPQLMIGLEPGTEAEVEYLEMAEAGTALTKAVTLPAESSYKFKIVYGSEWYGKEVTVTRAANTAADLSVSVANDLYVATDVAGEYTFTFHTATKTVTVTYPEAYTLAWDANGGEALSGEYTQGLTVPGAAITAPSTPARAHYTFAGWAESAQGAIVAVPATMPNADKTYYAQWTIDKYTITFMNGEVELQRSEVEYGATPVYTGATPTKAATDEYIYTFSGWTPEIVAVTGDAIYQATFSQTPKDPTAIGETEAEVKAVKFMRDNTMYIRVNGMIFDANGRRVE